MNRPFFIVQLNVNPEIEDEWNDWYREVHLPEVMDASSSILRATRFLKHAGSGDYKYAAVYEFDSSEGLREFMSSERLAQMSADYNEGYGKMSERINHAYIPFLSLSRDK